MRSTTIILNGQSGAVSLRTISFAWIEETLFEDGLSVTYRYPNGERGILHRGDRLAVTNGLVIDAYRTGAA